MNLKIRGLLIGGIILGSLGWSEMTASATFIQPEYSARRSNLFRLVWRKPMGSYSYTFETGGMYSKHIGTLYTWSVEADTNIFYTDAHEELYKKDIKKNVIYYHVKTADGKYSGWIWRKNLKPIKAPTIAVARNLTVDDMDWSLALRYDDVTTDEVQMMKLFPKTIYNNDTMQVGQQLLDSRNNLDLKKSDAKTLAAEGQYLTSEQVPFSAFKVISFVAKDPENVASVDAALTAAGYPAKNRAQFAGWHIGGDLVGSDDDNEGTFPGEGVVVLTKS
ncbi:hypothetical protein [Levilactobacillus enshiensis]|uniref:hypothetical protein n=1 Tax=Levilactobacillus enshiensis TaxID=2590213 RepID=UPI00117A0033|nr:hypothetical protein [Levilactobacillus enshiensis]